MENYISKYHVDRILYAFINLLFILKYVLRISVALSISLSVVYIAILCLLWRNYAKIKKILSVKNAVIIFMAYIIILLIAQYSIDPYKLQVDRWSAINNFLVYLFQGKYPYMAQTHLGGYGSPLPVWQIVHIPFYLLHNVGLSFFVALPLFIYSVYKYTGSNTTVQLILLIILSPTVLYEVLVRSDLITNFLIVATIVIVFYYKNINLKDHFFLIAITFGLLLSTRISAVIPVGLLIFQDWWKQNISKKIVFPLAVFAIFILTLLPFLFWNGDRLLHFEYSPINLQKGHAYPVDTIFFILIFIWLSFKWIKSNAKFKALMLDTAMLMIITVVVYFVHTMIIFGNYDLFSSTYDITYFDMALPFLTLGITCK